MNEEEEHAIWYFSEAYDEEDVKQWKVIENLIDKQQKEIIELDELYRDLLKKYNDKESVLDKIKELLEE